MLFSFFPPEPALEERIHEPGNEKWGRDGECSWAAERNENDYRNSGDRPRPDGIPPGTIPPETVPRLGEAQPLEPLFLGNIFAIEGPNNRVRLIPRLGRQKSQHQKDLLALKGSLRPVVTDVSAPGDSLAMVEDIVRHRGVDREDEKYDGHQRPDERGPR